MNCETKTQTSKNKGLEIGEKYLSISIMGQIKAVAFKNKLKTKTQDPDFVGNGVAVWVNEKKADKIKPSDII